MKKQGVSHFLSEASPAESRLNLLEMLFDRMPMGIAVIDRNFKLVRTNPTWAKFIEEYTPSKASDVLPGADIFDLEPGTEGVLIPLFERVFGGETIRQEAVRIEAGGIVSFWDIVLTPLYDGDQVVGLSNVSIDATERVESEQRLKEALIRLEESESMLRSVIENAQHFGVYRIRIDPENLFLGKVLLVSPSIGDMLGIEDPYRFESWFENIHPEDRQRVLEANNSSLKEGTAYNQSTRFFNKRQNRWCWVHTMSNPGFNAHGKLTHFDGIVVDLTEQKEAELALQEMNATLEQRVEERTQEIERRREIAESLRDILKMINANLPLDVFLERAVKLATLQLGASACTLHHFDREHQLITHEANYEMPPEYEKGRVLPFSAMQQMGGADYVRISLQKQPSYGNYKPLPDRLQEIESDVSLPAEVKRQRIALRKKFAGSLSVPLVIQDLVYGGMVFYYANPQEFTEEQVQLAMTFAEQVALAIESARLYRQVEQTAVATERSRLARDLHDAVTQTLFSASLIADVLPKLWERNPEAGKKKLDELRQLTRGALSEMRTMLMELRPSALAEAEIDELFRHLVNAFIARSRLNVRFETLGEADAPVDVKEVFYRVAQEALNNISKHAGAKEVLVQLQRTEESFNLHIRDDGCGFLSDGISSDHLGLGFMHDRAKSIHADLTIQSVLGAGTEIILHWKNQEKNNDRS